MIGRVTMWRADRAFGFVLVEGGGRVFLHLNDVIEPRSKIEHPRVGDSVEFDVLETEKGPRAVEARIVQRAEEAQR